MDEKLSRRTVGATISRRGLLRAGVFGVGAIGVVALAGCGEEEAAALVATAAPKAAATTAAPKAAATTAAAAPATKEAVTIQVWIVNQNDDTQKIHTTKIYPDFEAANPSIKIDPRWLVWDNNIEVILAAFAAGTPPDIFELGAEHSVTFSEKDQLFNIDPWLAAWEGTPDFFDVGLQTPFWKGHMWGLPHLLAPRTVFWRGDLLEAAGIAGAPDTWEEFVETAGKLTKVTDGRLEVQGMDPPDTQEFHAWYYEISSTPTIVGGKSTVGSADGITTMQFLVDRWDATGGQAGGSKLPESPIPYFVTGQSVGVYTNMGGAVRQIRRHKPEVIDKVIVKRPPVPGGTVYKATNPAVVKPVIQSFNDWLAVSAGLKHEEEAWTVLKHLMSPENLLLYNETFFFIPPRKSAADKGYMLTDHNPEMVALMTEFGVTAPKMPQSPEYYKAMNDAVESAYLKKVTPEEAVKTAAEDQDKIMADAGFTGGIYPGDDIRQVPVKFG